MKQASNGKSSTAKHEDKAVLAEDAAGNLCPHIPKTETPQREVCVDCPARLFETWRLRGAALRMEMRRHDLTFRELQVAELILDKTLGWGRADIVFPSLQYFVELTGIGKPDITKILKRLHARRILRIQTVKGRPTYWLNEDPGTWGAYPRVTKEDMQRTLNLLRENNGMEPIHIIREAEANFFRVQPAAKNFAAAVGKNPTGDETAGPTAEFPTLD